MALKEIKENAIDGLELNIREADENDYKFKLKCKKAKSLVKKAKTEKQVIKIFSKTLKFSYKETVEALNEGVINW